MNVLISNPSPPPPTGKKKEKPLPSRGVPRYSERFAEARREGGREGRRMGSSQNPPMAFDIRGSTNNVGKLHYVSTPTHQGLWSSLLSFQHSSRVSVLPHRLDNIIIDISGPCLCVFNITIKNSGGVCSVLTALSSMTIGPLLLAL